ncbi:hypothetical protein BN7_458 [Wickerhamomyces ciferrii]|uniref:Ornithine cyclodeaminase n=1 Tax=Wickerhamomyces ciferrii (strain ATCC 14091 / BCRC 22168 / CBS 111 / JCM 3599 / NBRC 0793 / NRRL Y-1031 F-60-10) TaxID=1206466 RepID=K0KHR6_WICCF|nr:uncharacterized protein BN7_458 [Wickerhamomyces ciferrii]CCH40924.1 hypothetical protein BN7_458 [Wickerhamomyces ciferrii]
MRVISDKQIENLLKSQSREGILEFQKVLKTALSDYNKDPTLIPERIVIKRDNAEAGHFFMPSFSKKVGVKTLGGSKKGFSGAVSIIDPNSGDLLGVLNARSLTAFRTALASTIPLVKFVEADKSNQGMTVYGNGLQAYWHVKLTLDLYPGLFTNVQIAVRSINEKSNELQKELAVEYPLIDIQLIDQTKVDLTKSSVIYGCIPSTEPQIKYSNLNKTEKTFISLIGSYKPHMAEVDNELVKKALSNGKIIVDSYEHTLAEAGELIQNNVTTSNVIETGELDNVENSQINNGQNLTLSKIVGLSIMDNSVGNEILERAIKENIGSEVEF